jgi:hypothetical protein
MSRNSGLETQSRSTFYFVRSSLSAALLAVAYSSMAVAQIDTDPTNDEQVTGDDLGLLPGLAISNRAALAAPGNDVDFFPVQLFEEDVVFGMTTPMVSLPSTFEDPDTMATIYAFGQQQTFSDDDFADELPFEGEMHGSLFRFQAPVSSTYYIGISGFEDEEFDGAATGTSHAETGDYILTAAVVTPGVLGGGFTDTDPANDTRSGADTIAGLPGAHVSVLELLDNDVDFFALTLSAGQVLSAMTAPLDDVGFTFDYPDTVLGLFDSAGTQLVVNDDAGDEGYSDLAPSLGSDNPMFSEGIFGSAIRALIPADGVYYLGVTGFEDDNFIGDHIESGVYALLIGVTSQEDSALPGDFNMDGSVDAADYVVWRKNADGLFDQSDYDDWRTNFGTSSGMASVDLKAVPEPTAGALMMIMICCAALLRRTGLSVGGHAEPTANKR